MQVDHLTPQSLPESTPEEIAHWYLREPCTYIADPRDWPPAQGPLGELRIFTPKRPRPGWRGYTGGPPRAA